MKLYDGPAAHTMAVRLFALERGGLTFDTQQIDVQNMENRRLTYRAINPRGEVPALQLDNGTVIIDIVAIFEYFDEIATSGISLYGSNAIERAETRMWLRRMDLEIAQPVISWFRNDESTIDFYQGNRIPNPGARMIEKVQINQALNRLEDDLEATGGPWLCGDRFSAADCLFYGLMKLMVMTNCGWVLAPGRKNFLAYWERMEGREASKRALAPFEGRIEL